MKAAASYGFSALVWGGIFLWSGHYETGFILLAVHFVAWQCHRLEVKVNRLLDVQGITVTDAEIAS